MWMIIQIKWVAFPWSTNKSRLLTRATTAHPKKIAIGWCKVTPYNQKLPLILDHKYKTPLHPSCYLQRNPALAIPRKNHPSTFPIHCTHEILVSHRMTPHQKNRCLGITTFEYEATRELGQTCGIIDMALALVRVWCHGPVCKRANLP